MKVTVSPGMSAEQLAFAVARARARRSMRRLRVPVSSITILAAFGAVVALWAPTYLGVLDHLRSGLFVRTDVLEWSMVVVGAFGLGGVLYLAWKDTRDPQWRAAHGLSRRPRSRTAGR